jgi:transposase
MIRKQGAAKGKFNKYDQRRLEKALKQAKDARSYRRIRAVLMVASGILVSMVCEILGVSRRSVQYWLKKYLKRRQVEDLQEGFRTGRPIMAEKITPARIAREFQRDPLRLGYNSVCWTVPLLATHLSKRYGCRISAITLRRRMKEMGLRWKRPRYIFSAKAPNIAQKKGQ